MELNRMKSRKTVSSSGIGAALLCCLLPLSSASAGDVYGGNLASGRTNSARESTSVQNFNPARTDSSPPSSLGSSNPYEARRLDWIRTKDNYQKQLQEWRMQVARIEQEQREKERKRVEEESARIAALAEQRRAKMIELQQTEREMRVSAERNIGQEADNQRGQLSRTTRTATRYTRDQAVQAEQTAKNTGDKFWDQLNWIFMRK